MALTGILYFLLDPSEESGAPTTTWRLLLLGTLSYLSLGWTRSVRLFPDAFPLELPVARAAALALGSIVFGAAAFAAARGRRSLASGAIFGLVSAATGWCASLWPQLSRAIELCGGIFLGLISGTLLTWALAATHVLTATALLRADWRPVRGRTLLAAAGLWAATTMGAQTLLVRVWGFGPRTLAQAVDVPTNAEARRLAVSWLYPTRGRSHHIEPRRMSSETTDLSLDSIVRLEAFLERTRFRGIFSAEALASVRMGYLLWWDEERALDALMISVPGRAHPDYLRALELLRAGPVSAERYEKLERLAAATGRRVEGFERAGDSQLIFEGFSAAYARFGDEAKSREWLGRVEDLWSVSEKKIEVGTLEDLREGRVDGSLFLDERPAVSVVVGLFLVWTSSATHATHYWLSGSRIPDEDGRFSFESLGPGHYALALLGRPEDLRGAYSGVPGFIEVDYERPQVMLKPVRVTRETTPSTEAFNPGGLPPARTPRTAEPPLLLWR